MLLAKQYVVQPLYTLFNQSLIAALCIALVVFSLEHLHVCPNKTSSIGSGLAKYLIACITYH
jgi:hypothetical protein